MSLRKFTAIFIMLPFGISMLNSCHCGGCDRVDELNGIHIISPEAVNITDTSRKAYFAFFGKQTSRDGDRHCFYKNLVVCRVNPIDMSSIRLITDSALDYGSYTVPAYTNLWDTTAYSKIEITSGNTNYPTLYINTGQNFKPGIYHFYISAKTSGGQQFFDTANIRYY